MFARDKDLRHRRFKTIGGWPNSKGGNRASEE
jgi:hypothetical protein